jgi:hypothetical protein
MYEFHGWIGLAESTEEADAGNLDTILRDLRALVERMDWQAGSVDLAIFNGGHFLRMDGLINRRRDEAREVTAIFEYVAEYLPGSWGLLYERSADMPEPPGQNAFRVGVLARGKLEYRLDPFLSPCRPVIED